MGTLKMPAEFTAAVNAGNVLQYPRTQPWTIIADVMQSGLPGGLGGIIAANVPGAGPAYQGIDYAWINSSGQLHMRLINDIRSTFLGVRGTTNISDGIKRRIAITYDGSSTPSGVKLYLNGTAETMATERDTLGSLSCTSSSALFLGNQAGSNSVLTYLGPVRISNIERSPAYIASYGITTDSDFATLPPVDANTVLAYDWSEGKGSTAADLSATNATGTLVGAATPVFKFWDQFSFPPVPTLGQISRLQNRTLGAASSASALSVALSSNVSAGSLIIVSVATFNSNAMTVTLTDSRGNTYTQAGSYATNSNNRTSIWYARNSTAGACTVSIAPSAAAFISANVSEYSGVRVASPLLSTTTGTGSGSAPSAGTATITNPGDLIVAVAGQANSNANMWRGHVSFNNLGVVSGASRENACFTDQVAASSITANFVGFGAPAWAASAAVFASDGSRRRRLITGANC